MPDVSAFLARLATATEEARVRFTWVAADERADLGWSDTDALREVAALTARDLLRTEASHAADMNLIWAFCPLAVEFDRYLWIRLVEDAGGPTIIGFHLAERDPWT